MDILTKEKRSWNMSQIKSKDTAPEMIVRSFLHKNGLRYKLHDAGLPGNPDIILPKYNAVVLVNGCFWHMHEGCKYAYTPKSKKDFWMGKLYKNKERDKKNRTELKRLGWRVFTIWECEVNKRKLDSLLKRIIS